MVEQGGAGSLMSESSPATHRRVWFLALLTGVVVSTLIRLRGPIDIDTWLHLRIGDELRSGERFGVVPDPLVVIADRPYIATQWLSQVIFSFIYQFVGLDGILLLRLAALLVLLAAVFAASRLSAGRVAAAIATLVGMTASSAAWAERPQVLGLALHGVLVLLWVRAQQRRTTPWLVVPLMWLWACVHGTWILGLATGLVFMAGAVMDNPGGLRRFKGWFLVNGASFVAVALTPLGPRLLVEPFNVGNLAPAMAPEWQRPSWSNPLLLLVLAMVGAVVIGMIRRRSTTWTRVLLAAGALALSVYTVRTIAFGAVLVAPAFAAALSPRHGEMGNPAWRSEAVPWLVATAVLTLLPGALIGFPKEPPVGPAISSELDSLPTGTHVAVDLRVSGWFLHSYPDLKPLRDVRAEIYTAEVAADFESFMQAGDGWQSYVQTNHVHAFVLARDSALSRALAKDARWSEFVAQGDYALWVSASSAKLEDS